MMPFVLSNDVFTFEHLTRKYEVSKEVKSFEMHLYDRVPVACKVDKFQVTSNEVRILITYSGLAQYETITKLRFSGALHVAGNVHGDELAIAITDQHGYGSDASMVPLLADLAATGHAPKLAGDIAGLNVFSVWEGEQTVRARAPLERKGGQESKPSTLWRGTVTAKCVERNDIGLDLPKTDTTLEFEIGGGGAPTFRFAVTGGLNDSPTVAPEDSSAKMQFDRTTIVFLNVSKLKVGEDGVDIHLSFVGNDHQPSLAVRGGYDYPVSGSLKVTGQHVDNDLKVNIDYKFGTKNPYGGGSNSGKWQGSGMLRRAKQLSSAVGKLVDTSVEVSKTEAAKRYRVDADAGNATAMVNLGICYENGDGVAKDPTEAVRWYRRAAEAGNTDAMVRLAGCYNHGIGMDRDIKESLAWMRKAARLGNAGAKAILRNLNIEQ